MKQNKLFFGLATIAAAALSFAACSSDEPETSPRQQETKTISFTSSLEGSKAGTRAASDLQTTAINSSVHVGIFGVKNETTEYTTNGGNNEYTVSGTNLVKVSNDMSFASESVNIYAYAPYASGWGYNTANSFSVQTDQSTEANYLASDLLRGAPESNPVSETSSAINLTFVHKMARIKVTVSAATGSTIDVSGAQVTINNTNLTTTFNPSTDVLAASAETSNPGVINAGTGATTYAIVVPQEVPAGTKLITVFVDGKTYIAKLGAAQTFESGYTYEFTITAGTTATIPETSMTLAAPSISAWGDGTESSITSFGIGDYIMADGSIVANSAITISQKDNVRAIIFSTDVSETDASSGYVGYAMAVEKVTGGWANTDNKNSTPGTFAEALADLNGLSRSSSYMNFNYIASRNESTTSNWFVPSFGQLVQIINNLGGANITSSTESVDFNKNQSGDIYSSGTTSILSAVNSYVTKFGKTAFFSTNDEVFTTCTENDDGSYHNFFYLKVTAEGATSFGLGKSAGKSNTSRQIIPCLAFKLPTN